MTWRSGARVGQRLFLTDELVHAAGFRQAGPFLRHSDEWFFVEDRDAALRGSWVRKVDAPPSGSRVVVIANPGDPSSPFATMLPSPYPRVELDLPAALRAAVESYAAGETTELEALAAFEALTTGRWPAPPLTGDSRPFDFHPEDCWRCDSVTATSDVGLCAACLAELRADNE